MADEHGARGLKLHTIALRAFPGEAALAPTFATCEARALPVVAHCGPDRHGAGWALPGAFAPVLERHPGLPLVLAHLGGAAWREVAELALAFPSARFDLSEIVSWSGHAPGAPNPAELSVLIREIGAERVLLGSDFPWYEPGDVVAAVEALPGLGPEERAAILGGNAPRCSAWLNLARCASETLAIYGIKAGRTAAVEVGRRAPRRARPRCPRRARSGGARRGGCRPAAGRPGRPSSVKAAGTERAGSVVAEIRVQVRIQV